MKNIAKEIYDMITLDLIVGFIVGVGAGALGMIIAVAAIMEDMLK